VTSAFVPFTPSTVAAFTFQPTIAGAQYNATVTQNVFGQDFYLNLTDANGNPIIACEVNGGGPQLQASLMWSASIATVTTTLPHNVPVGAVAKLRVSNTGTAFDGNWQMLATGANTLTYALSNPNEAAPISGTVDQPLNLIGSVIPGGWLYYHEDTTQFEFSM
jgi:hypothetical protein